MFDLVAACRAAGFSPKAGPQLGSVQDLLAGPVAAGHCWTVLYAATAPPATANVRLPTPDPALTVPTSLAVADPTRRTLVNDFVTVARAAHPIPHSDPLAACTLTVLKSLTVPVAEPPSVPSPRPAAWSVAPRWLVRNPHPGRCRQPSAECIQARRFCQDPCLRMAPLNDDSWRWRLAAVSRGRASTRHAPQPSEDSWAAKSRNVDASGRSTSTNLKT